MRESVKIHGGVENQEYTALKLMEDTRSADLYPAVRSPARGNWSKGNVISLTILCFVNLINYMDRYTVSAILEVLYLYLFFSLSYF